MRRRRHDRPVADEVSARRSRRSHGAGSSPAPHWPTSTKRRRPSGSPRRSASTRRPASPDLTLGGGFGWITRKFGLTVDNLISADVVTADAKLVRASEKENQDLFWALRGGGGNFGVVTSFEFKLHPLGPEVLSGLVVHPLEKAAELLPEFRRIAKEAPDELTTWVVMRKAPPLPFLPTEWHGKEVLIFAACYSGDMKEGEKAVRAAARARQADRRRIAPHPFTGWQAAFDPLLTPGARNYWKSHDFTDLPDAGDQGDPRRRAHAAVPRMRGVHRSRRRRHGAGR